jgi:hypothetical protein
MTTSVGTAPAPGAANLEVEPELRDLIATWQQASRRLEETYDAAEVGEGGGDAPNLASVHGLFCMAFWPLMCGAGSR